MVSILLPALYFVVLFGVFEVFLFRRGIAYWQKPYIVSGYFLAGIVGALTLFSLAPLQLVLQTPLHGIAALVVLFALLCALAWYGYFTYGGSAIGVNTSSRYESMRYVAAKSFDIAFQDTLVVIVALALLAYLGDATVALLIFALYFFIVHTFLASVLPFKFAVIFAVASAFAGLAFGTIVIFGMPIIYVYILHWLFYAATYTLIKRVRKSALPNPVYHQLYGPRS